VLVVVEGRQDDATEWDRRGGGNKCGMTVKIAATSVAGRWKKLMGSK